MFVEVGVNAAFQVYNRAAEATRRRGRAAFCCAKQMCTDEIIMGHVRSLTTNALTSRRQVLRVVHSQCRCVRTRALWSRECERSALEVRKRKRGNWRRFVVGTFLGVFCRSGRKREAADEALRLLRRYWGGFRCITLGNQVIKIEGFENIELIRNAERRCRETW